jgi:hypothetical protein
MPPLNSSYNTKNDFHPRNQTLGGANIAVSAALVLNISQN